MKKINDVKNNLGITLVALVITIVVLLILAGISISALTNTGLFKKTNEAVTNYKISQMEEQMKLAKLEATMNTENKSISDVFVKNGIITEEQKKQGFININNETIFITNYEGLKELSDKSKNGDDFSNKYVYLLNDIDCQTTFNKETGKLEKGENFEPIKNFNGLFDGNEYKIQNLYIKTENSGAGIILNLNKNGSVKNLIVDNGYIDGYNNIGSISGRNYGLISNCTSQNVKLTGYGDEYGSVIGGIVGKNFANGKIENCTNKSDTIAKNKLCGGICGYSLGGNISNCTNYGNIIGNAQVGGIVGDSQGTQDNIVFVTECTNYGTINEKHDAQQSLIGYIGGIVGCNAKYSEIINCTNKANVIGTSASVGGISGINHYKIKQCSNEGKIETSRTEIISGTRFLFLGGISGYTSGNIEECGNIGEVKSNYNTEDNTDGNFVGGICGAISFTNSQDIFDDVTISKCYNYGTIDGAKHVGGITGRISTNSSIEYCFNKGNVNGDTRVGGISGDIMNNNARMYNSYNTGIIKGNIEFGGVCGTLEGYIENSYSVGEIIYNSSSKRFGSFLGYFVNNSQCKNSYYLIKNKINGVGYGDVSGSPDSIIGKSESELKNLAETLGYAYAQDDNLNEGYPYLKENKPIK